MTKTIRICLFLILAMAMELRGAEKVSVDDALAAKNDVWGQAAVHQPNGPSYEFFEKLLPPMRYVDAAFRYYPIVLSAPGSRQKARLISNGSAINARANLKTWKDFGLPVLFEVGEDHQPFGQDFQKLRGPNYEAGYLPVVQFSYRHEGATYQEEFFATTETPFSEHGLVYVQFKSDKNGKITARPDAPNLLILVERQLSNTNGTMIWFGPEWQWDGKTLTAELHGGKSAMLAIASMPMPAPPRLPDYAAARQKCITTWQSVLDHGAQITVPEPVVNNASRASIIGAYMLLKGHNMNYSAGNQYERLYEAECGDSLRALMLFGHEADARPMIIPQLDYTRTNGNYSLRFHQAAFKLQMLAHYYWVTRDTAFVREQQSRWSREVSVLLTNREAATGLLPKEQYAGDIFTRVNSLNSNANGWKGLHDIAAVLADMGESAEAKRIAEDAADFRKSILTAVEKSEYHDTTPPFIPLGLFGAEKPYDKITDTKMGSYYNEMASYIIGSGVFGFNAEREKWMIEYLQQHGGICMGLIRFHQHSGLFANENGLDDLYSLRYVEKLLQRDDANRALTGFYGKLAQGLTRDTFIGAEGTSLKALDQFGRPMYCPPNSSANAFFLWTLRDLLVQDWDMDDDGQPETLRLLFATPRRWLEAGKKITVEKAPTAFGPVSVRVNSSLRQGKVTVEIEPPHRNRPKQTLLRLRLPDGYKLESASISGKPLRVDDQGTMDISDFTKKFIVSGKVKQL